MVATSMVEKLGLDVEDHPKPYQLTWLKKGSVFKAKHDGFWNTYSFRKDGINIVLAPLDTCQHSTDALILTKSQFGGITKLRPHLTMLALVVTEANLVAPPILVLVQPLMSQFQDVFPHDIPPDLPQMRDIKYCIDFLPGSTIPNKPAYRINPKEINELHKQVTELCDKGLIRESISPCVIPALLVPKHDGTFHMCIDSRAVNKITFKYRFPIPRFNDLIDQLHEATVFSKIDLRSGYHQIRMHPRNEWKTTFKTRDGLYEWMVIPFGLCNAPSTFMRLMNHVFKPFIGRFVVVYFEDILFLSRDTAQHLLHLQQVFCILREQKLYANRKKCHFLGNEVVFLGYLVSGRGIMMDTTKVEAITSWPTPTTIHDIRSFYGLASFYHCFIRNFSSLIVPMTGYMKGGKFKWTTEADDAFTELKKRVTQAPVLSLPKL
ncbi:reverse transcriptase domain-containing protein [Tanacetum coccineum]